MTDPSIARWLFRHMATVGIAVCVFGILGCVVSAFYGFRRVRRIYEAFQSSGLAGVTPGDVFTMLLIIVAFLAGLKTFSNGRRLFAAGIAPHKDKYRKLAPLKTWKKSETVGSPSLRFASFILPIWFNANFILGAYAVFKLNSPVDQQVLLHYLSMTFMGMAFVTQSWNDSRFEGIDLSTPENARLLNARSPENSYPRSKLRGFALRLFGIWACMLGPLMTIDHIVLIGKAQEAATGWRIFYTLYVVAKK